MKLNWPIIIAASAGIAAGVTSSLLTSARAPAPAPAQPAAQQQPIREYVPVLVPPSRDPVEEVQTRTAQAAQPGAAPQRGRAVDDQQLFEEQKRATHARHEALIKAHHDQPVDPGWSGKTAALLKADLAEVAQGSSFEVVETECKTTSCLATMQWPTFGKAQADWRKLLHHGYQANCSREITLPDPSDQDAPYKATLVLDCEGWRAESQ